MAIVSVKQFRVAPFLPFVLAVGTRGPGLLVHHYSLNGTHWDMPWGQPNPDGNVVIFNSNMNGSGRYDLFVAEMPLR